MNLRYVKSKSHYVTYFFCCVCKMNDKKVECLYNHILNVQCSNSKTKIDYVTV